MNHKAYCSINIEILILSLTIICSFLIRISENRTLYIIIVSIFFLILVRNLATLSLSKNKKILKIIYYNRYIYLIFFILITFTVIFLFCAYIETSTSRLRILIFCPIIFSATCFSIKKKRDIFILIIFMALAYLVIFIPKLPSMVHTTKITGTSYYNIYYAKDGGIQDWQIQRNCQAWMINAFLGLPFILFLYPIKKVYKTISLFIFLALSIFNLLTFSRNGFFGLLLTIAFGIYIRLKRISIYTHSKRKFVDKAKFLVIAIFLVLFLIYLLHDAPFVTKSIHRRDNLWMSSNLIGRPLLYFTAFKKWLENPFFGAGGNASDLYHTFWLGTLCETGFFYTALWLFLFIIFYKRHKKLILIYKNPMIDIAIIDGIFVCMIITALNAITDNTFKVPQLMTVFFIFRGIESFYLLNHRFQK